MRCSDVASLATEYAEGALGPWNRLRLRRHLAGCADCRAYFEGLQATARALPQLSAVPLEQAQQAQALRAYRDFQLRRAALVRAPPPGRWAMGPLPLAVGLSLLGTLLGTLLARHRTPLGAPWFAAALATLAACGLIAFARRRGMLAAALACAATLALALLAGDGELAPAVGIKCLVHELATAALPLVAWITLRRGRELTRPVLAGVAAAGAFAGAATLHLTCPHAHALPHVLVFHLGGVLVAAVLAALAARAFTSSGRGAVS
ncbi:MAG: zf-HC2 domain-containing protein [Polyangiales bacterium]